MLPPKKQSKRISNSFYSTAVYKHSCVFVSFPQQVITINSSQSASTVTSTVPSVTSTLQPLVKVEPGSGPTLPGSRPMQKYIVVSLPSSNSSMENKSSVIPTPISTTLEPTGKTDRSESPGASTQSPH